MISVTSYIEKLTVKRKQRGLTLIELVFVVAILAILAGFLLPRLGIVRNLALAAGEADQTHAALDQVVLYNVEQGKYPQGLDTLVEGVSGGLYGTTSTLGHLDPKLVALLTTTTFTAGSKDLLSLDSQLTYDTTGATHATFFAHDVTAKDQNASGKIATDSSAATFAKVKTPIASDVTNNTLLYQVYKSAYGVAALDSTTGAPLDSSYLIAVGFGPGSELIGKTTLEAPIIATRDPLDYQHPIELLRIFGAATTGKVSPGTAAATAGALSPIGNPVGAALTSYQSQKDR